MVEAEVYWMITERLDGCFQNGARSLQRLQGVNLPYCASKGFRLAQYGLVRLLGISDYWQDAGPFSSHTPH